MLRDTSSGLSPARAAQADGRAAQLFGDAGGRLDSAARQKHAESIAAHPGYQRALASPAAQQVGDTLNDLVADVHSVILIDHVQLIDIDIEQPVGAHAAVLRWPASPRFEF